MLTPLPVMHTASLSVTIKDKGDGVGLEGEEQRAETRGPRFPPSLHLHIR